MTWEELKSDCLTCTKCDLCETRANVVFGDGVADAEVLFIGEGRARQRTSRACPLDGRSARCW